jgi:4-hydroxy-tetrahydrodipicolinate reductase
LKIRNDPQQVFDELQFDICIVATATAMEDVYPALELCARHGIHAITTAEELLYPWTTSPAKSRALDQLCKENNCTLTGSGYQDVFWGHLITVLTGATLDIRGIHGFSCYNTEYYGKRLAELHGIGYSPEEFAEKMTANAPPSYMWHVNEWLCSYFGWTIKSMKQENVPIICGTPVFSKVLNREILKGEVQGMSSQVITETHQNVVVQTECVGEVYSAAEQDQNKWTIYGTPDITVDIPAPATAQLTCTTIVNRIPQVIEAPAGLITCEKLSPPVYWR